MDLEVGGIVFLTISSLHGPGVCEIVGSAPLPQLTDLGACKNVGLAPLLPMELGNGKIVSRASPQEPRGQQEH